MRWIYEYRDRENARKTITIEETTRLKADAAFVARTGVFLATSITSLDELLKGFALMTVDEHQKQIASELAANLGIDPDRVFFINKKNPLKPWLPPDVLEALARKSGEFQAIDDDFQTFIGPLNQVVHKGTVVDRQGRSFGATGVATIGEKVPDTDEEFDEHVLARGRALGAALDLAGFNPLRTGLAPESLTPARIGFADEAELRNNDLGRIHILAVEAELIRQPPEGGKDTTRYKTFLMENFGTDTAASLSEQDRKCLIRALEAFVRKNKTGEV